MKELTQEKLKELLNYNPDTGVFTWRVNRAGRIRIGVIAGKIEHEGYVRIKIDRKDYKAHRLAFLYMTGEFPPHEVDHINHTRGDNRFVNLRPVTRKENTLNRSMSKNNKSGTTGVSWSTRDKKWTAIIRIKGVKQSLGSFKDKKDAVKVRKEAEVKYGFHPNHGT